MAADVSSLVRLMKGGDGNQEPTAPITRDLLGGICTVDSQELELDLGVPSGWEKRLDLKSGKVYVQRCDSSSSSEATTMAKLQDPNGPRKPTLNLFNDCSLDLQMSSPSSTCNYQSVCTLDKVKSALERAERQSGSRKRSRSTTSSKSKSTSPVSGSSSSECRDGDELRVPLAVGCPSCLMYVLVCKGDPKCPRCNGHVPLSVADKKPWIDLNVMSI